MADPYELGQEFFRWEFATAVAGSLIGINPFDQPDVQAAKDRTNAILDSGDEPAVDPEGSVDELIAQGGPGDYFCVQAFVEPTDEAERRIEAIRERARAAGMVTTARVRAALPALDRAAAQGRPGQRALPPDRRRARGASDPGPNVRVRATDSRAGGRRLRGAARARPQGRKDPLGKGDGMKLGMVGLGRMGGNMAERPHPRRARDRRATTAAVAARRRPSRSWSEQLEAPRVVWLMIPAGDPTEQTVDELLGAARRGRRDRRRRQLELPRLEAPRGRGRRAGDPLRRHRRVRRDLGTHRGLLPDGRRRRRRDRDPPARVRDARARERLRARRPVRRGALREDGPQRDRVRAHAGLRRGLRGDASAPSSTSISTRSPGSGATARSCARGSSTCSTTRSRRKARTSTGSRATWTTPARAAGRSPRRSPRTCRSRSSRRRSTRASPRARTSRSRPR